LQTRVSKIEPISVRAAEAARMVGLRSAADFRKNFKDLVKPLPLPSAELYSIADIKHAIALLSYVKAPSSDVAWLEQRALQRLAE
jgi:hypothetical protein